MSDPLEDLKTIRNNPLDDLKDIRSQVTRTSTPGPAQAARARLASRGLTPEMVKSGKGITTPEQFSSPPGMSGLQMVGAVGQGLLSAIPGISPPDPTNLSGPMAGVQSIAEDISKGNTLATSGTRGAISQVPIVGPPISNIIAPSMAQESNRPVGPSENLQALEGTGQVGGALIGSKLLTAPPKAPEFSADLLNHYLGEGAIDPILNKDAGRGITQEKIIAPTAKGIHEGVKEAIPQRQSEVKQMLDSSLGQAPTIDGNAMVDNAFGEPPLNATKETIARWNEFKANLKTKVQDISNGTGKVSPTQVDSLKNDIDVSFGKLSADATELNLNEKAASVRRSIDHTVDAAVPGYEQANNHLADLHHADKVLTQKITENRTAPPFSLNPKSMIRGIASEALGSSNTKGTRSGVLPPIVRTALGAMLSKAPEISPVPGGAIANPPVPQTGSFNTNQPPAGSFTGGTTFNPPNPNPLLLSPPTGMTVTPQGTAIPQLDMSTGMAGGVPETPGVVTPSTASSAGAPTTIDPWNQATQTGQHYLGELKSGARPSGIDYKNPEYRSQFVDMFNKMRTPGSTAPPTAPPVDTTTPPEWNQTPASEATSLAKAKTEAKVAALTTSPADIRPDIVAANRAHNVNAAKLLEDKYPIKNGEAVPVKRFPAPTPAPIESTVNTKASIPDSTPASSTPQINAKPTHIQEGTSVSGIDTNGNLVSGTLEKVYPTMEGNKPVWKGTILDLRNSRTVDLPTDNIFDKLAGPPKSAIKAAPKSKATIEIPAKSTTPATETAPLDKGTAAKKAVQDWLDRQSLARDEEQNGAGSPRKGKK